LFLATFSSCDKEEMIVGSWNLQTVLKNNNPLSEPYPLNLIPKNTYYYFSFANNLIVRTKINGDWAEAPDGFYTFIKKSTIEMRFTLKYLRYNITAKIKKLTNNELHLEYESDGDIYYLKLYSN
jgi:hypothetical protein